MEDIVSKNILAFACFGKDSYFFGGLYFVLMLEELSHELLLAGFNTSLHQRLILVALHEG